MDALVAELPTHSAISSVNLHPLAMFTILDFHARREVRCGPPSEVFGALFGSVSEGVAVVTDAVGVRRDPNEQIHDSDPIAYVGPFEHCLRVRHELFHSTERFIGWFRVSDNPETSENHLDEFALFMQENVFANEIVENPSFFHLFIDLSLTKNKIDFFAYRQAISNPAAVPVPIFQRLYINVCTTPEERIALHTMVDASQLKSLTDAKGNQIVPNPAEEPLGEVHDLPTSTQGFISSVKQLKVLLEAAKEYVSDVLSGKIEGDKAVGRAIADALNSVVKLDTDAFHKTYRLASQDVIMVAQLAFLLHSQVRIADRISSAKAN